MSGVQCPVPDCGTTLTGVSGLGLHITTGHPAWIGKCDNCGKLVMGREWDNHRRVHLNTGPEVANLVPLGPPASTPKAINAPLAAHSRVPINIDPEVRDALRRHLTGPAYAGTGVGYSEFIRRALTWDLADRVPAKVQPDWRWNGTYFPSPDAINGPNCKEESEEAQR